MEKKVDDLFPMDNILGASLIGYYLDEHYQVWSTKARYIPGPYKLKASESGYTLSIKGSGRTGSVKMSYSKYDLKRHANHNTQFLIYQQRKLKERKEMAHVPNSYTKSNTVDSAKSGKYIVGSIADNGAYSIAQHPVIHNTDASAQKEALRLSVQLGKKMVVLQVVGVAKPPAKSAVWTSEV